LVERESDSLIQRKLMADLAPYDTIYMFRLTLIEKRDAVCRYANYGGQRAKFFTRNGRDILRFVTRGGGYVDDGSGHRYNEKFVGGANHMGFYVPVSGYSKKDGFEISESTNAGIVYEMGRDEAEFVHVSRLGYANEVTIRNDDD
jgi:hypothetical protein